MCRRHACSAVQPPSQLTHPPTHPPTPKHSFSFLPPPAPARKTITDPSPLLAPHTGGGGGDRGRRGEARGGGGGPLTYAEGRGGGGGGGGGPGLHILRGGMPIIELRQRSRYVPPSHPPTHPPHPPTHPHTQPLAHSSAFKPRRSPLTNPPTHPPSHPPNYSGYVELGNNTYEEGAEKGEEGEDYSYHGGMVGDISEGKGGTHSHPPTHSTHPTPSLQ